MARIKGAMMTRKRRNKMLKAAKGYWGAKSKHFKMAKQQVMKSGNYAFAGCTALETVYIGGANTIGSRAFEGCTGLKNVYFYLGESQDGICAFTEIGSYAFAGMINLFLASRLCLYSPINMC